MPYDVLVPLSSICTTNREMLGGVLRVRLDIVHVYTKQW